MTDSSIDYRNIEKDTIENKFYRKVLFTTANQQLVLMSIKPKDDVPYEMHRDNDQFVRIEKGRGQLLVGPDKKPTHELSDGVSVVIPAGTWHQIVNTSDADDLKLYTVYSPPHHPRDLIEADKPKQCGGISNVDLITGGKNDYAAIMRKYRKKNYLF